MGVEGYCTCSKDYGEKNFTLSNTNDKNPKPETSTQKNGLKLYDNYFRNINLINSNYFSINPTNHNNNNSNNNESSSRKWQNCVPQKSSTEVFFGRASDVSSINNSIVCSSTTNNLNIPITARSITTSSQT